MDDHSQSLGSPGMDSRKPYPLSDPFTMIIFGASGYLTKRLLVPALYNLACDELLDDRVAVLGTAMTSQTTKEFRDALSDEEDGIKAYHTRKEFEPDAWANLIARFHYLEGAFDDIEHFKRLKQEAEKLGEQYDTQGNILFYCATAPKFFGTICDQLYQAGFREGPGWRRIIVEKPFGTDLQSAQELNRVILTHWDEEQIFRVDHYLGKETVQNLLMFRFSNGMFEPLWNRSFIDNIQFNVCESVDVQDRGGYYDTSGVLRDMMQNHMFQMLAYLCMEPPLSFEAGQIRNEKAKLLESIHAYAPEEVPDQVVRGQYGPLLDDQGDMIQPGYRGEKDVASDSNTETFAAIKLKINNWRWEGVPIYLRSGKALWKRSTEIVVQFKKAPESIFAGTAINSLASNRLVFHIQPHQGIELLFQAKIPGPTLKLQNVDMVFNYGDAFRASRYTGYEVMLYSCSHGDATLFSRGDLVEAAWKVAQPILDYWRSTPEDSFPNYSRNSWGPIAADDLIERDGRRWYEAVTTEMLERSPLFKDADHLLLNSIILALQRDAVAKGETIINIGDPAREMYLIYRGTVEILDGEGKRLNTLKDGDFFGEVGLLMDSPRTATVKTKERCDLFVLTKTDFIRILKDHHQFADMIIAVAKDRYDVAISKDQLLSGDD